ncbi:hypothetical protein RJT34_30164 [Clitoria ternatea]|uniref:FAR1 domain-containing protein n=1 Tax=Clitoria ternatea TaxID=43366 RepID=A0AAN9ERV4_CLITE
MRNRFIGVLRFSLCVTEQRIKIFGRITTVLPQSIFQDEEIPVNAQFLKGGTLCEEQTLGGELFVISFLEACALNLNTDSFVGAVEFGVDGSMNGETGANAVTCEVTPVSNTADENRTGESSVVEPANNPNQDDNVTQDSSGVVAIPSGLPAVSVITVHEPYVGQEFDSEAEAHAFYNAYATNIGFIIRVSKLSRSRRDGSVIGRALVCNKEGYRMPDRREKIVRQRAETRVGCRAMLLVRKVSSGKWVITKFIKEHTHPLALNPGRGRREVIFEQYPNEHDKIQELNKQLAVERKRSANYKRQLELIFEHIEEHNENLSRKIQHIVDSVKEMESEEQPSRL